MSREDKLTEKYKHIIFKILSGWRLTHQNIYVLKLLLEETEPEKIIQHTINAIDEHLEKRDNKKTYKKEIDESLI